MLCTVSLIKDIISDVMSNKISEFALFCNSLTQKEDLVVKILEIKMYAGTEVLQNIISFCLKHKEKKILFLSHDKEMSDKYSNKEALDTCGGKLDIKTVYGLALEYFKDFKIDKIDNEDYAVLLNRFFDFCPFLEYDIVLVDSDLSKAIKKGNTPLANYLHRHDVDIYGF